MNCLEWPLTSDEIMVNCKLKSAPHPTCRKASGGVVFAREVGRGTSRVIATCDKHGAAPAVFEERQGFVVVTFMAPIVPIVGTEASHPNGLESQLESLDRRVLAALREQTLGKGPLAKALGQKQASGPLHDAIRVLLAKDLIERTILDKLQSRLQKYRLTAQGKRYAASGSPKSLQSNRGRCPGNEHRSPLLENRRSAQAAA